MIRMVGKLVVRRLLSGYRRVGKDLGLFGWLWCVREFDWFLSLVCCGFREMEGS